MSFYYTSLKNFEIKMITDLATQCRSNAQLARLLGLKRTGLIEAARRLGISQSLPAARSQINYGQRKCASCDTVKHPTCFSSVNGKPHSYCRKCRSENYRLKYVKRKDRADAV